MNEPPPIPMTFPCNSQIFAIEGRPMQMHGLQSFKEVLMCNIRVCIAEGKEELHDQLIVKNAGNPGQYGSLYFERINAGQTNVKFNELQVRTIPEVSDKTKPKCCHNFELIAAEGCNG